MINTETSQKIIGIYKITSPTGRIYIGQSTNIINRKSKYKNFKCKSQPKIYSSIKKYGWEQHQFDIIEECELNYLDEIETWWKLFYNSVEDGLNCHYWDGKGGYKSEETKAKMSKSGIGKHPMSDENKKKISNINEGHKYNVGRKHSKETNEKRNNSLKGRIITWEVGRPTGYEMSEEEKIKHKKPKSEETKTKMRKPRTEKGKQNMRVPKINTEKMRYPRKETECPYCGKKGKGNIMKRFHFERCLKSL